MNTELTNGLQIPADSLVYVVDDEESIRRGLGRLFHSAGIQARTFGSATEFLESNPHDGPSCLVLDVRLPRIDGLELQQMIATRDPQIVFLTGHGDVPTCADAMKAGAVDFLTKPVDEEDLLQAVARALVRSAEVRRRFQVWMAARNRLEELTPREFEVMRRVIAGMLNKQIAEDLHAAEKTIKIHRGRVMEKMGVTSVASLVRVAQSAGVSPVPSVDLPDRGPDHSSLLPRFTSNSIPAAPEPRRRVRPRSDFAS